MNLLLVEDDLDAAARLIATLAERELPINVVHVASRGSAFEALEADGFDYIVCGIELPSTDAGDDLSVDHGFAVYDRAFDLSPGTATLFLTGKGDQPAAREKIAGRAPEDLFGRGEPYPMAQLVYKHETPSDIDTIEAFARELELLDRIEVSGQPLEPPMGNQERRVLRIFARRYGATSVDVTPLSGRSDARTLRAHFTDREGAAVTTVIAKLGPVPLLLEEEASYQAAAVRLDAGAYAPLIDRVTAGAGKTGGLFFSLAARHSETLYQLLQREPEAGAAVANQLRSLLKPWRDAQVEVVEEMVSTLRGARIDHGSLGEHVQELHGPWWRDFERLKVTVRRSLQHGDLHGANVLVDDAHTPLLLDFANVAPAPSCFDPVMLELSLIFQAESPFRGGDWPTLEQCEQWADVDAFTTGSPAAAFVRACRQWSIDAAAEERSVCAVAYSEAMRQLAFPDAPHDHALAIARGASRRGAELAAGTAADEPTRDID